LCVYVDERYQGRGLAKSMMRKLLDIASADCWRAILYVRATPAKSLYRKFGFEPLTLPEYNGREVMELEFNER
jgi:ribosomal protein S18 acetylase RimI-like enzyme